MKFDSKFFCAAVHDYYGQRYSSARGCLPAGEEAQRLNAAGEGEEVADGPAAGARRGVLELDLPRSLVLQLCQPPARWARPMAASAS